MGVEICSRSATGHNFLLKLSVHSDMDHLGVPTSYFRQLTWTHSDKSLKPICHSEKPVSPSRALSVLLLPGAFQHLSRAGGEEERPEFPLATSWKAGAACPLPRRRRAEDGGAFLEIPLALVG